MSSPLHVWSRSTSLRLLVPVALAALAACSSSSSGSSASPITPVVDGQDSGAPNDTTGDHGGSDGGAVASTAPAVTKFYSDFQSSDYAQSAADALALDDAASQSGATPETLLVRALSHLWHVAEFGRDANPQADGPKVQGEAMAVLGQFQAAQQAAPDDPRIACWIGISLIDGGRQLKSDALVQQGLQTIADGVAKYPEFNLFCQALVYADLPASDPDYMKAPEAMLANVDACVGESIDRNNPDITKYLSQETDQGKKRVCWDNAIAPHGGSGFYLYLGDLLVKAGKVPQAKIAYNDAKLMKGYASWPYKSLLDDRLNSDLDARAAAYQDADSTKWPKLGGDSANVSCTYCHASSAK